MKLATIRLNGKKTVIVRVDDTHAVALAPATMEDPITGAYKIPGCAVNNKRLNKLAYRSMNSPIFLPRAVPH